MGFRNLLSCHDRPGSGADSQAEYCGSCGCEYCFVLSKRTDPDYPFYSRDRCVGAAGFSAHFGRPRLCEAIGPTVAKTRWSTKSSLKDAQEDSICALVVSE